jgi:hypothetical protein
VPLLLLKGLVCAIHVKSSCWVGGGVCVIWQLGIIWLLATKDQLSLSALYQIRIAVLVLFSVAVHNLSVYLVIALMVLSPTQSTDSTAHTIGYDNDRRVRPARRLYATRGGWIEASMSHSMRRDGVAIDAETRMDPR